MLKNIYLCVLPFLVFQKKAFAIWAEIRQDVRAISRVQPETSSTYSLPLEAMNSLEEFDREELQLRDEAVFKTLVGIAFT